MPTLERSNPLPLYYQLKEVLKQQIRSGHLAPHTAIPSEPELVSKYQVSRATVRQALSELVNEGLLYRQHGRGTFVCEPRVQQNVTEITSLSSELQRRGKRPGGILLHSELSRGTEMVRQLLHLSDEEQVVRFERLRSADGVLIAYEIDYLPYPRATAVYQRAKEVADGSLYALMASEGLIPYIVEQTLNADGATAREAELLQVSPGHPGISLTATTSDQTGSPIAYAEYYFPGGRYDFQLILRVGK
ncbi:MAG TPA: GntR family transcriptional regulator [Ktedonobacteraceae bacterium]|jgi:GntR family transcriptional regulator|nr:GntR family transcriptional regulator [Ktedonobacteraceae bacterium]